MVLTVVVTALVGMPLLRAPQPKETNPDIAFYKSQLAELDRDEAAGRIAPDDAATARIEVSRRLLAADADHHSTAETRRMPLLAAGLGALVLVGSVGLYSQIGAPGYGDFPLAKRLAAAQAVRDTRPSQEAMQDNALPAPPPDVPDEYRATVDQLRKIVPTRPNDSEGWRLLALHEGQMRNYAAAAEAQAHFIALQGDAVTLDQLVYLADVMVAAAGGFISPQAELVVDDILALDPEHHAGRYYKGALYYQTDRADVAFRYWRPVVANGDPTTYHVNAARSQIEDAAFLAGEVKYTLPPAAGPTAEDIENAQSLAPDERAAMISGMVQQLSDRLASEGGTAQDWARLITAHGVLGNTDQATAIYGEAISVFGASQDALDILRDAAERAGVTP